MSSSKQRMKALMHGESSIIPSEFIEEKEKELVEKVCTWTLRLLIYPPTFAVLFEYLSGQGIEQLVNPASIVISCLLVRVFVKEASLQGATVLVVLAVTGFRHAILYQGCSACVVPTVYGFIPCASGLLFRTARAVYMSAALVLTLIAIIYTVDLTGNCPSEPIEASDKATIVADRLVPLLMAIIGNSLIFSVILRQSQESLLMHTEAAASARNLANLRRDVLHRVTHELRTPLNGLVGSVELLTVSDTLSMNDMENVLTIKRCLNSILGICDDVLVAAKESDRDGAAAANDEEAFVLASCIDDVVEVFAATVQAKGIQLKVQFEGDTLAVVRGLEVRLRQILLNLTGNAVKFTDAGSVTIQVETHEEKGSGGEHMLRCRFQVRDTGIGIDSKDADMLFEPFHQGEQGGAVSRRHQGTGLGLTICRDLVKQMGGKIAADGVPGQGSCFYFSLLMKKEPDEQPTLSLMSAVSLPPPCHVVIAGLKKESLASCQSVINSVVAPIPSEHIDTAASEIESPLSPGEGFVKSITATPSVQIDTFDTHTDMMERIAQEDETLASRQTRKVAFIEYAPEDPDFPSILVRAKKLGWRVFVLCDRDEFSSLVETTIQTTYAVFRRPLPLVRVGQALRDACMDAPPAFKGTGTMASSEVELRLCDGTYRESERKVDVGRHAIVEQPTHASAVEQDSSTGLQVIFPNTKIVVVDDTTVNVRVLVKMLSRYTSTPIIPLYDGESAIDLARNAQCAETLLFLLDWHMPGVCGLTAWQSIRKIVKERGGPRIFVCMVTADIEGFCGQIERNKITYGGTISRTGTLAMRDTGEARRESKAAGLDLDSDEGGPVIDMIAGKPVTFQSVQAILTFFAEQVADDTAFEEDLLEHTTTASGISSVSAEYAGHRELG